MKPKNSPLFPTIFLIIVFCYVLFVFLLNKDVLIPTGYNHYNYLLSAFIHGRLDVVSPYSYDLSFYQERWFLYWGPAATLFIAPFYFFNKVQSSDIIYTAVAGLLNAGIFYLLMKEFSRFFRLKTKVLDKIIVFVSFALASPNFYLSLAGRIWHTNQIVAVFYLLISLWLFFRFLNVKKTVYGILAAVFFNLAWMTRFTLAFYIPVFIGMAVLHLKDRNLIRKVILSFAVTGVFFAALFLTYNYLRFGSAFETGYRYQKGASRFDPYFKKNEMFSAKNIPHNFEYYFVRPAYFSVTKPHLVVDREGSSVFSIYPLTALLIVFWKNIFYKDRRLRGFFWLSSLSILLILAVLMMNVGTGWIQLGNRYFFDVIPLVFLLAMGAIGNISPLLKLPVFIYSLAINLCGAWVFYH